MKRLMVFCMILLLCLQVFSGTAVYGAGPNLALTYELPGGETAIYDGDDFQLKLKYTNQTDKDITDVKVSINDSVSNFYWLISQQFTLRDMAKGSGEISTTLPDLTYKGKGQTLALKLTYKLGGVDIAEDYVIAIRQAHPTDTSSGSSGGTDASKLTPKLGTASGNNIPTITAGNSQVATFPVKNSSIYQAKNVLMTLKMLDEAKAPSVLEDLDLRQTVDLINGNDVLPVSFNIRILKSAPAGLYALKLNYSFQSAYGYDFTSSETVYIRVKNDDISPKLTVDNVAVQNPVSSSSNMNLEIKLKNIGSIPAKDIKITLKGLKSGGFTTYNSTDVKYLNKIEGNNSATVTYQLIMPATAAAGSNELSVKMDYKDESGTAYTDENQIFVPVGEGEDSKPSIVFDKIVSPQEVLSANKDFQIALDLKNNGGSAAKNIKVTLTTDKEIVTKSLSPVYLDKIDSKIAKTVVFKLFATDESVTRNYPLAVNVEYEDLFGTKYTASQYVGVYVENGSSKTVPKIIVDKYSIDPPTVQAASDFKLKMSFLNTSRTTNVSNIKVTVSSDDGTFTPTDSGNTFYLESIPKKGSVERELMLHVKPDAEQKSYILTVNFEYEDEKGNPFTTKEVISVRVLQNPRLMTGEISLPPETFMGQPLSIYVDFYNMGKSTLYNMMVKAEGSFTGQNLNYYVGNFASGSTDSFDASVIPTSPGALKGSVLFSFEDANGKVTEIKKEFTVNVMEMPKQGPMLDEKGMPIDQGVVMVNGRPMPGGMQGQKTSLLIYIIPAVAVITGIIVFIILRKRHKRRKEMSLDE
jgi:hypothetical protein